MRGTDHRNDTLFSYVRPDSRVPANHPLRPIRRITDIALKSLSGRFDAMYSEIGRPSIPPEKLLRALLLVKSGMCRAPRREGQGSPGARAEDESERGPVAAEHFARSFWFRNGNAT